VLAKLDNGEIVVMMPGSGRSEVARVAKKMKVATDNCVLPLQDRELNVRFSHGIAELKANETAHELIARARQEAIDSVNAPQPAGR
jgi:PleD family two-component response regulator